MHKQTVRYLIGGVFALVIAMGIGRFRIRLFYRICKKHLNLAVQQQVI